ncbi:MAG: hypothetical protein ACLRLT_16990 [Sellimonas intestinalis]
MKKAYEVESSSLCGTAAARQDFVTPLLFTSAAGQSMIDAETAFVR